MAEITDEFMREMLTRSRPSSLLILKAGPIPAAAFLAMR